MLELAVFLLQVREVHFFLQAHFFLSLCFMPDYI